MLISNFHKQGRRRQSRHLSVLLTLLLVLTPVLSLGSPIASAGLPAAGQAGEQMPCHGGQGTADAAGHGGIHADCPHCAGDAPAAQCHCAGHGVPAGLGALPLVFGLPTTLMTARAAAPSEFLPDTPPVPLYRPPARLS